MKSLFIVEEFLIHQIFDKKMDRFVNINPLLNDLLEVCRVLFRVRRKVTQNTFGHLIT